MKINFKNKKPMIAFNDLKPGDIFKALDDETYWMVLGPKKGVDNAVNIENGAIRYFNPAMSVYPVNCTLTIED